MNDNDIDLLSDIEKVTGQKIPRPKPVTPAPAPRVNQPTTSPFDDLYEESGRRHGVDPALLREMGYQESRFRTNAVSPKGARGPMQIMPATAQRFGVTDPTDPKQAIEGAAKYMRFLLDTFKGDVDKALAGYNAGEGAVMKYGGIPPFRETQDYVKKIRGKYTGAGRLNAQAPDYSFLRTPFETPETPAADYSFLRTPFETPDAPDADQQRAALELRNKDLNPAMPEYQQNQQQIQTLTGVDDPPPTPTQPKTIFDKQGNPVAAIGGLDPEMPEIVTPDGESYAPDPQAKTVRPNQTRVVPTNPANTPVLAEQNPDGTVTTVPSVRPPRTPVPIPTEDDVKQWLAYNKLPDTGENRMKFAEDLRKNADFGRGVEAGYQIQAPPAPQSVQAPATPRQAPQQAPDAPASSQPFSIVSKRFVYQGDPEDFEAFSKWSDQTADKIVLETVQGATGADIDAARRQFPNARKRVGQSPDGAVNFTIRPAFLQAVADARDARRAAPQKARERVISELQTGFGVSPQALEDLLTNGVSIEDIQATDGFQQAAAVGGEKRAAFDAKVAEIQKTEPSAFIAQIMAARELGMFPDDAIDSVATPNGLVTRRRSDLLIEAERNAINAERTRQRELMELEGGRAASMSNVSSMRFDLQQGAVPKTPRVTDAEVDQRIVDVLRQNGVASVTGLYKKRAEAEQKEIARQARIRERIKFSPLAQPLEFAKSFGSVFAKIPLDVIEFAGNVNDLLPTAAFNEWIAGRDVNPLSDALKGFARSSKKRLDDLRDEDMKQDLLTNEIPDALGQVTSQLLLGTATGGLSLAIPLMQGANQANLEAENAGAGRLVRAGAMTVGALAAVPDVVLQASYLRGLVSPSSFLNKFSQSLFSRLSRVVPQQEAAELTKLTVGAFAKRALASGLAEPAEEYQEDVLNDIFKKLTYKPSIEWRDVFEITPERARGYIAAGFGGLLGGGVRAVTDGQQFNAAAAEFQNMTIGGQTFAVPESAVSAFAQSSELYVKAINKFAEARTLFESQGSQENAQAFRDALNDATRLINDAERLRVQAEEATVTSAGQSTDIVMRVKPMTLREARDLVREAATTPGDPVAETATPETPTPAETPIPRPESELPEAAVEAAPITVKEELAPTPQVETPTAPVETPAPQAASPEIQSLTDEVNLAEKDGAAQQAVYNRQPMMIDAPNASDVFTGAASQVQYAQKENGPGTFMGFETPEGIAVYPAIGQGVPSPQAFSVVFEPLYDVRGAATVTKPDGTVGLDYSNFRNFTVETPAIVDRQPDGTMTVRQKGVLKAGEGEIVRLGAPSPTVNVPQPTPATQTQPTTPAATPETETPKSNIDPARKEKIRGLIFRNKKAGAAAPATQAAPTVSEAATEVKTVKVGSQNVDLTPEQRARWEQEVEPVQARLREMEAQLKRPMEASARVAMQNELRETAAGLAKTKREITGLLTAKEAKEAAARKPKTSGQRTVSRPATPTTTTAAENVTPQVSDNVGQPTTTATQPVTSEATTESEPLPRQDGALEATPTGIQRTTKTQTSGVKYVKDTAPGETSEVFTEGGQSVPVKSRVIDLKDVITSLDPDYPAELQPRDRSRSASKAWIAETANKLNPAKLGDSPVASAGRPLVVPIEVNGETKYAVVSGNGRTAAIRTAYESGNNAANTYRDFASGKAQSETDQPVYVGILDPDSVDLVQFAKDANKSEVAAMSSTEQAISDAEGMDAGLMASFVATEDGSIHNAANRNFIRRFLDSIVGSTEQGRLLAENGELNQDGVRRIKNAIFAFAFGDSTSGVAALERVTESTDNNVRVISNALLSRSAQIAELRELIARQDRFSELDIAPDLVKAMEKYASLRQSKTTIEEFISQGNLFGSDVTPLQTRIIQVFDKYRRSSKAISSIIGNYLTAADAAGSPKQGSLFGDVQSPSKDAVFAAAVESYENNITAEPEQVSLFDTSQGRENQLEARPPASERTPETGDRQPDGEVGRERKTEQQAPKVEASPRGTFLNRYIVARRDSSRGWELEGTDNLQQWVKSNPDALGRRFYDTETQQWVKPTKTSTTIDRRARREFDEVPDLSTLAPKVVYTATLEEYKAEVTRNGNDEWGAYFAAEHETAVKNALLLGKTVPAPVLADYPDLARQLKARQLEGQVGRERKTVKSEPSDFDAAAYNRERDAIPVVKDDQGNLLAPNGKKSNLNEFLWKTVRTPQFKKWFGDWENDPENASKVVDENGEPLVVYHGDSRDIDNFTGLLTWFSADPEQASEYAKLKEFMDDGSAQVVPAFINLRDTINADAVPRQSKITAFFTHLANQALDVNRTVDIDRLRELTRELAQAKTQRDVDAATPFPSDYFFPEDYWHNLDLNFGANGQQIIGDLYNLLGFDGVEYTEDKAATYGVFDSANIKSINNRGSWSGRDNRILRRATEPQNSDSEILRRIAESRTREDTRYQAALNERDLVELLPDVEAIVRGDEVKLSLEAGEVVRTAAAIMEDSPLERQPNISGAFNSPGATRAMIRAMSELADVLADVGVDAKPVRDLADKIETAAKENGTVILNVFDDAIAHERGHQTNFLATAGMSLEMRVGGTDGRGNTDTFIGTTDADGRKPVAEALDAAYNNFFKRYGYRNETPSDRAVIVEETWNHIQTGEGDRLGLSPEQRAAFAYHYAKALVAKHGERILDDFQAFYRLYQLSDAHLQRVRNELNKAQKETDQTDAQGAQRRDETTREGSNRASDEGVRGTGQTETRQPEGENRRLPGTAAVETDEGLKESRTPKTLSASGIPVATRLYAPVTNAGQQEFADNLLDQGADVARQWFYLQSSAGNLRSGDTTAVALSLMNHYGSTGDMNALNDIADRFVPMLTEAGQAIQAMALVSMYNPELAGVYAGKLKSKRTGRELTKEEYDEAKRIAQAVSDAAKAEGVSKELLDRARREIAQLIEENEILTRTAKTLENDNERMAIDLTNLKAELQMVRNRLTHVRQVQTRRPNSTIAKLEKDLNAQRAALEKQLADAFSSAPTLRQIVGETGAARLEDGVIRLQNLDVARQMETAGKDAKTIWLATGWEKGVDGKWKTEIPDAKFADFRTDDRAEANGAAMEALARQLGFDPRDWEQFVVFNQSDALKESGLLREAEQIRSDRQLDLQYYFNRLGDRGFYEWYKAIIGSKDRLPTLVDAFPNAPALKAYPELKNIPLVVNPNLKSEARYNRGAKVITLSDSIANIHSTLLHEIQHAIQDIEGFARGGNPAAADVVTDASIRAKYDELLQIDELARANNVAPEVFVGKADYSKETVQAVRRLTKRGEWDKFVADIKNRTLSPMEFYRRLAGETEARNVETRLSMTDVERAQKTLAETEDIDRESQIVLDNMLRSISEDSDFDTEAYNRERDAIPVVKDKNGNLLAPNGKKSNLNEFLWKTVRTPQFKAWFGDWENDPENASKVVDDNGEPMVVYHGTGKDFDAFSRSAIGSNFGFDESGFFFTNRTEDFLGGASQYAKSGLVVPVFLSIKDPFTFKDYAKKLNTTVESITTYGGEQLLPIYIFDDDRESLISYAQDSDGLVLEVYEDPSDKDGLYIAFNPTQIKSINNRGSWSNQDDRMLRQITQDDGFDTEAYNRERDAIPVVKDDKGNVLAPNGKKSNLNEFLWKTVRTPQFKKWFGDWENDPENASKAVDVNGEPKVFYHGTATGDFEAFSKSAQGKNTLTDEKAFFFTDRAEVAEDFAGYVYSLSDNNEVERRYMPGSNIIPVFLDTKNPSEWDFFEGSYNATQMSGMLKEARRDKNDGLLFDRMRDGSTSTVGKWKSSNVAAVFNPTQIKSINNRGSWSNQDDRMLRQITQDDGFDTEAYNRERDAIPVVKDKNGNLLASNGKKSNLNEFLWKTVRTPQFKAWFGDWENDPENASKAVDANGEPKVFYHGTNVDQEFDAFEPSNAGIFFTDNRRVAEDYARGNFFRRKGLSPRVVETFLNTRTPVEINAKGQRNDNIPIPGRPWSPKVFGNLPKGSTSVARYAMEVRAENTADGLLISNVIDTLDLDSRQKSTVAVVFDPAQAKSTSNRGSWSNQDDRMLRQITEDDGFDTEAYNRERDAIPVVKDKNGNLLAPNGKKSNLNEFLWKTVRTPQFKRWFGDWENDAENASKVVDENGEPLVVYHGTNAKFDAFTRRRGTRETSFGAEYSSNVDGFFFSPEMSEASEFGSEVYPVFLNARQLFIDKPSLNLDDNTISTESYKDAEYILEPITVTDVWMGGDQKQRSLKIVELGLNGIEITDTDGRLLNQWLSKVAPYGLNWNALDNEDVVERLRESGYDGTFVNEPDLDSGLSIFVLNPAQIKSINNRGSFSNADDRMLRSVSGDSGVFSSVNSPSETETFFSDAALASARRITANPKSREILVTLPIDTFLNLAAPLPVDNDYSRLKGGDVENLLDQKTKFSDLLYIGVNENGKVRGHEGRHRALALKQRGFKTVPVLFKSDNIRWGSQSLNNFDRVDQFPLALTSESGEFTVPFPFVLTDQGSVENPAFVDAVQDDSAKERPSDRMLRAVSGVPEEQNLFVAHNLTQGALLFANKLGGLAAPSLAITTRDSGFSNFGEITLIGDKSMAEPSRQNPITDADMYSPRFPQVFNKIDKNAFNRAWKPVSETSQRLAPYVKYDYRDYAAEDHIRERGAEGLGNNKAMRVFFLDQTGRAVPQDELQLSQLFFQKELASEYRAFVDEFLEPIVLGFEYFDGFTYTGKRRYRPVTLDTIVKKIKSEMKQGENFNYGAGTLRAAAATRFSSIKQIQRNRDRITTKQAIDAIKAPLNDELILLGEELAPFYEYSASSFGYMNEVSNVIAEGIKNKRLARTLEEYGFKDVSGDVIAKIRRYVERLVSMPTEYFEAKPLRPVMFSEFRAAVVPNNISERARKVLENRNIPLFEYDANDPATRQQALNRALDEQSERTLFSITPQTDLTPDQRDALVKLAALDILDGKSYDETIAGIRQRTNGTIDEFTAGDVHFEAYSMVSNPRGVQADEDRKAAAKIRAQHSRRAKKFLDSIENPETTVMRKTRKIDKSLDMILKVGAQTDEKGNPKYSDAAMFAAVARKSDPRVLADNLRNQQAEIEDETQRMTETEIQRMAHKLDLSKPENLIARMREEFPDLPASEIRRALADSNEILKEAATQTREFRTMVRENRRTTEEAVDNIIKERDDLRVRKARAVQHANGFYNALTKNTTEAVIEAVVNYRKANLLTGVKTHAKNLLGNVAFAASEEGMRAFASLADIALSRATGRRTVQGISPRAVMEGFAALVRQDSTMKLLDQASGYRAAVNILRYGDTAENLTKLQVMESHLGDKIGKFGVVADTYINFVFRTLSAEDALFKVYAFRRSLEEQARLEAKNSGRQYADIIAAPTSLMEERARQFADEMTFQNNNWFSTMFARGKNAVPYPVKATAEFFVPFDRTPTNIVLRTLEYTPAGFVFAGLSARNLVKKDKLKRRAVSQRYREAVETDLATEAFRKLTPDEQRAEVEKALDQVFGDVYQREFSTLMGRATFGTFAGVVLGFSLASLGMMAGAVDWDDEEGDERNLAKSRQRQGIDPGSVKIKGVRFRVADNPWGKAMLFGATLYEQADRTRKKKKDAFGAAVDGAYEASKDVIFEQPLARAVREQLQSRERLGGFFGNMASGLVPASGLMRSVAEITDDKARRASMPKADEKNKSFTEIQTTAFKRRFVQGIPGLRTTNPEQTRTVPPAERGGILRRIIREVDPVNFRNDPALTGPVPPR